MVFILIILILSAILSGTEAIFQSANRLKVELSFQQGKNAGFVLNNYLKNPSKYNFAFTLGNVLLIIAFGFSILVVFNPIFQKLGIPFILAVFVQIILATTLFLIFGVYVPQSVFRLYANKLMPILICPFNIIYWILQPMISFIKLLNNLWMNIFKVDKKDQSYIYFGIDTDEFIKEHEIEDDNVEDDSIEHEFIENVLDLKNLKARDCMVPRREISAVSKNCTIAELKQIIIKTNHSRILVYEDSIDKILGYIHHFDLHKKPEEIKSILIPIKIVPETMHIQKLLNEFIKDQKSIAWVVDEYGGTAGVITLEDILEEIFGEIDDEYDKDEFIESQLSENEYILSGRLEIDYINKEFNLSLPEGDYETLSGFIIEHYETIPQKNEIIEIGRYLFKIMNVSETKIETVKLEVRPK